MAQTPANAWPYCGPNDTPDVPYWQQRQAEKGDALETRVIATEKAAKGLLARNANNVENNFSVVNSWQMFDLVAVPLVAGRWYEVRYTWTDATAGAGVANQPYAVAVRQSATNITDATGTDIDGSMTFWTAAQALSGNAQIASFSWQAAATGTFNLKACFTKVVGANQINITARRLTVTDLGKQF